MCVCVCVYVCSGAGCVLRARYAGWYERGWRWAEAHFIDKAKGAWYPMVNASNVRTDTHAKPGSVASACPANVPYPCAGGGVLARALACSFGHVLVMHPTDVTGLSLALALTGPRAFP